LVSNSGNMKHLSYPIEPVLEVKYTGLKKREFGNDKVSYDDMNYDLNSSYNKIDVCEHTFPL